MECTLAAVGTLVLIWLGYKLIDYLMRLPNIGDFNGRYIFISGCDSGFGQATAKKLDKMGCRVFAGCYTEKGEADLKLESSDRLKTVRLDVTNPESVKKAYSFVERNLPAGKGLWGIVNNAGIAGQTGPCEWVTIEDYKACMDINAYGVIDCAMTFLPLIKKERGRVVNMASIMGRFSQQGSAPYSVSKFAVEAFTDCLRRDMHPFGVGVSVVEPGYFKTSIINIENLNQGLKKGWDRASDYVKEQYGEEYLQAGLEYIPKMLDTMADSDISGVVNAYVHALTSVCPRPRYVVGNDAKFIYLGIQALPEWLGDYVIRMLQTGLPKPAACLPNC